MGKRLKITSVIISLIILGIAGNRCWADAAELATADNFVKNGQYAQAEPIYQQIITANPGTDNALNAQKGLVILYENWKPQEAGTALGKIISDFSGNPKAVLAVCDIAVHYNNLNQGDKAKRYYQCVADTWPSDEQAMWSLFAVAKINMAGGDDAGVHTAYQRIISNYSSNENAAAIVYEIAESYRQAEKNLIALPYYKYVADNCAGKDFAVFCQMYVVTLNFTMGNDEAAKLALKKLLMDYSSSDKLATAVWEVSQCCRKLNKFNRLDEFYQYALDTAGQGEYMLWPLLGKAGAKIWLGDYNSVDGILNQLSANYSQHPYIANALALIGEEYYLKSFDLVSKGQSGKDCLQKAVPIWEKVVNEHSSSSEAPRVCCWLGDCYRRLSNYQKSNEFYNKVVDTYPQYEYAWHALFMVGQTYESMGKTGVMPQAEADVQIKAVYKRILEEYPDSMAVMHASNWLNRHNSK